LALACHSLFFLLYGLWRIEMNEDDLRDCFAMFAMMAVVPSLGGKSIGVGQEEANAQFANMCFSLADAMLVARKKENDNEEDSGIAAVVPKRPRKR
jgi:hypothetical protein